MKKLLFVILLALIYFVYDLLLSAGAFKSIIPFFDGQQIAIYEQAVGTEDLDIDYESGDLFVSSIDRRNSKVSGAIFKINLDTGNSLKPVWSNYSNSFRPHGISFLKSSGKSFLFVINHISKGDFVEKFEFKDDSLFHLQTFQSDLMISPNDLVAIGENKFYVTNDHGYKKGLMRVMEDYCRLPKSYVLFYDGNDFNVVASGLRYANGINVSGDGKKLYVSQTTGQALNSYLIGEDGRLTLDDVLPIKTGLDNIHIDNSERIWIGAHPKMLDFVKHAKDPNVKSPSQVLMVEYVDAHLARVKEVFLDDGKKISGSSVAVPYKNDIFIGAVYDSKVFHGRFSNDD